MSPNVETRYQVRVVRRHMLGSDGTFTQDAVVAKTKVSTNLSVVMGQARELEQQFERGTFAFMLTEGKYLRKVGR